MTIPEAQALLAHPRPFVRVRPKAHKGRARNHTRAKLLGVDGEDALVKPMPRHRQVERVPLAWCKAWKSGMAVKA